MLAVFKENTSKFCRTLSSQNRGFILTRIMHFGSLCRVILCNKCDKKSKLIFAYITTKNSQSQFVLSPTPHIMVQAANTATRRSGYEGTKTSCPPNKICIVLITVMVLPWQWVRGWVVLESQFHWSSWAHRWHPLSLLFYWGVGLPCDQTWDRGWPVGESSSWVCTNQCIDTR